MVACVGRFYQILLSLTNILQLQWPRPTLLFLNWMRIFTFDLMVLPFVGCLTRTSFVNIFCLTVLGPLLCIAFMSLLYVMGRWTHFDVWRFSIFIVFVCCESATLPPYVYSPLCSLPLSPLFRL